MVHMKWKLGAIPAAITLAAAAAGLCAPPAAAVIPQFPNNLEVLIDSDVVSVLGYSAYAGQAGTVEVNRPGVGLIGSTSGIVRPAAAIFTNNPALLVNELGGICWGAGGGLQVTPDIQPGDVVSVSFNGSVVGDLTVPDLKVLDWRFDAQDPSIMYVEAMLGKGVSPRRLDARIVSPGLAGVGSVLRNDVRALVGPVVKSVKGNYWAGIEVQGNIATATFDFDSDVTARIAALGEVQFGTWETTDPSGNPQGLTVAELGMTGTPAMGACPRTPKTLLPPRPTMVTATQIDGSQAVIRWRQGTWIPGTDPVLGFTVRAVDGASQGLANEVGVRVNDPSATSVTVPWDLAGKTVEVRAITANGDSFPPSSPSDPAPDEVAPDVFASSGTGSYATMPKIRLLANEQSARIYYTDDGTEPWLAGVPTVGARLYAAPIVLPAARSTVLKYMAVDVAGNASKTHVATYTYEPLGVPSKPSALVARGGKSSITATWAEPVETGAAPVTGYRVTAVSPGQPTVEVTTGLQTRADVLGVTNGRVYSVSVRAINAQGEGPPATFTDVTPSLKPTDALVVLSASWKPGSFIVVGTGSQPGATISIRTKSFSGPVLASGIVVGPGVLGAPGTWKYQVAKPRPVPAANPGPLYIVSSAGGVVGPVAVTR